MKNFIGLILFVVLLTGCHTSEGQKTISIDEFEQKLSSTSQAQLVDVRTPDEFGQGHLKSATNANWRNSTEFQQKTTSLDKSKPIFVYCLAGGRSREAATYLVQQGFKEVYDMKGGFMSWSGANKTIETEGAKATAVAQGMTKEAFDKFIQTHDAVLVDYFATWCGPCQKMKPIIEKLKAEGKITVLTLDADQSKALIQANNIDELPTFMFYKKGKMTNRAMGYMTEATMRTLVKESL
jgi:thioredoxin 1